MTNFRFRLATVLKLRERERDNRREELSKAYQAADILREKRETVDQQIIELQDHVRDLAGEGPLNVETVMSAKRHELQLKTEQAELQQHGQQLAQEIERRHEALIQADRELRCLEKLRDRQHAEHAKRQLQQEYKLLDEAGQRCRRQEI